MRLAAATFRRGLNRPASSCRPPARSTAGEAVGCAGDVVGSKTTVLFLHGIDQDDPGGKWLAALDRALVRTGGETVSQRGWAVLAPTFLDLLRDERGGEDEAPPYTYRRLGDATERRAAETGYWRRLTDLERRLAALKQAAPPSLPDQVVDRAVALLISRVAAQADRYCRDARLRNAILRRVLADVPADGELIIVAHSLGSVVAADLLYHLPGHARVKMVITLGSPLSLSQVRRHLTRLNDEFPFERTGPWLNAVGHYDLATACRGISAQFPEISDFFVDNGSPTVAHDLCRYLEQEAVVTAFNWADPPHGSEGDPGQLDVPMNEALVALLVGGQYALRLEQALDPDERRVRFATARDIVASDVAAEWRLAAPDHPVLARLVRDNAGLLRGRVDAPTAVTHLLSAWLNSPIRPFEIDVDEKARRRALANLAADLDVPLRFAARRCRGREEGAGGARCRRRLLEVPVVGSCLPGRPGRWCGTGLSTGWLGAGRHAGWDDGRRGCQRYRRSCCEGRAGGRQQRPGASRGYLPTGAREGDKRPSAGQSRTSGMAGIEQHGVAGCLRAAPSFAYQ